VLVRLVNDVDALLADAALEMLATAAPPRKH
jgi:hypothetical protein